MVDEQPTLLGTLLDAARGPGSVVGTMGVLRPATGEPDLEIRVVGLGHGPELIDASGDPTGYVFGYGDMTGSGCAISGDVAATKALVEAFERYASCVFRQDEFIWATAEDLGDRAMPLGDVPTCSEAELADPRSFMLQPQPSAPIRWTPGIRLSDMRPVWLPAVMVYVGVPPATEAERFWNSISTGCAAHVSYADAVLRGILECVERDAVTLTWLLRLPLPRIGFDDAIRDDEELPTLLARFDRSDVEVEAFDATTDLGIPVTYVVHRAKHDPTVATSVGAGCGFEMRRAVARGLYEGIQVRPAIRTFLEGDEALPERIEDYSNLIQGAAFMGRPDQAEAFSFLGSSGTTDLPPPEPREATMAELRRAVDALSARGMEVYVSDITCRELREVGMVAVRVLVPKLQPLSFVHRARYLATPRLADVARWFGVDPEPNPLPQPFA